MQPWLLRRCGGDVNERHSLRSLRPRCDSTPIAKHNRPLGTLGFGSQEPSHDPQANFHRSKMRTAATAGGPADLAFVSFWTEHRLPIDSASPVAQVRSHVDPRRTTLCLSFALLLLFDIALFYAIPSIGNLATTRNLHFLYQCGHVQQLVHLRRGEIHVCGGHQL